MDHAPSSKLLAHCPLCQVMYDQREIRLLSEKGSTRLFHCTCRGCGHALLAFILEQHGSVSSVGLVTDLEADDASRFHDRPAITADECLEAHKQLNEHSQDLVLALMPRP